jgi:hypothetical protein
MAAEKAIGPESTAFDVKFPFFGNSEWVKSISETPMKFYISAWKEGLEYFASCLQDQAEYTRKLSQCTDPAEALKCHGEFAQKTWTRSRDEGAKILENVRTNFPSAAPLTS